MLGPGATDTIIDMPAGPISGNRLSLTGAGNGFGVAAIYNDARGVFVPCELQGGGERAVLEGRACGCDVEIADDNPKLASLLDCPIWSHEEYAARLLDAIEAVVDGRRIPDADKLAAQRAQHRAVIADKVRRAPSTVRIRVRDRLVRH